MRQGQSAATEAAANSTGYWASAFRGQHVSNVEGVFALGRLFEECAEVGGETLLVEAGKEAGYKKPSINKLRAISRCDRMTHIMSYLPSGWGTLYELVMLSEDEWGTAVEADAIHPNMTQADARKLRRPEFNAPHDLEDIAGRAYEVIYADPPWRYEHVKTESRAIENQYPTMSLDEICALKVPAIAADDAVLFLWATSPKLAESMQVIESWGFTYRTSMVWVKDKIGMGYYARQRHELLLIATRGQPGAPPESSRPDSVIEAPRQAHSAKPEGVYPMLEGMYPDRRRVELFARSAREGWDAWGNQAGA